MQEMKLEWGSFHTRLASGLVETETEDLGLSYLPLPCGLFIHSCASAFFNRITQTHIHGPDKEGKLQFTQKHMSRHVYTL